MEEQILEFLQQHVHRTFNGADSQFQTISNFLKQHHPIFKKTNTLDSVRAFRITRTPKKLGIILQVQYQNNKTWHPISWKKCIPSKKRKNETDAKGNQTKKRLTCAMRHAIQPQIQNFRDQTFGIRKCANCECTEKIEIDHNDPPFSSLADQFIDQFSNEKPEKFYWNPRAMRWQFLKKNASFQNQWCEFHQNNATLQWLCNKCNLSKSNKTCK